jgi:hypothetical protein
MRQRFAASLTIVVKLLSATDTRASSINAEDIRVIDGDTIRARARAHSQRRRIARHLEGRNRNTRAIRRIRAIPAADSRPAI